GEANDDFCRLLLCTYCRCGDHSKRSGHKSADDRASSCQFHICLLQRTYLNCRICEVQTVAGARPINFVCSVWALLSPTSGAIREKNFESILFCCFSRSASGAPLSNRPSNTRWSRIFSRIVACVGVSPSAGTIVTRSRSRL